MDLRDILSPDKEAPRPPTSIPTSPAQSPRKFVQRTQSTSSHKHTPGLSPFPHNVMLQANIPAHVMSPLHPPVASPLISPVPTAVTPRSARHSPVPGDPCTDSISHRRHSSTNPQPSKSRDPYEKQISSPFPTALGTSLTSNPRASYDINMVDMTRQEVRMDFTDSSLPVAQQERLSELITHLQETPSAYDSHTEAIKILHDGFMNHVYPSSDPGARGNPRTYDLLPDLHNAREYMAKFFAVGEIMWIDWLQDESMLARTAEERLMVTKKFRAATLEEVASTKIWTAYGDWVQHCFSWASDVSRDSPDAPDEDKMLGRELFTKQMVEDVWQHAVEQTVHNLAESHLTWDKYLAARVPNWQDKLSEPQVELALSLFQERLQTPHLRWDDTFQAFSSFVSSNLNSHYEDFMSQTSRRASSAKTKASQREYYEGAIEQAQAAHDRSAEYLAFTRYIEWERTPEERRQPDGSFINAVFQRAELHFPSDATLWEEHVAYVLETEGSSSSLLDLLERACKHCPWSGSLWSQCLLMADSVGQGFQEVEAIKHNATSTGLLEVASIDETIKVHAAWCSYLRRRSTGPNSNEEDIDVAEMGIRTSIENVSSLAAKLGLGDAPDPSFRLHRIYITFLTESGRWDNARSEFDNLVRDYGKSYEFWMRFYQWEMMRWRRFAPTDEDTLDGSNSEISPPHLATAILKKGLDQPSLDYPEPIMQALITHCEDYEDADELLQANLKIFKMQKIIAKRREVESAQALPAQSNSLYDDDPGPSQGLKRKRDEVEDEVDDEIDGAKKLRNGEAAHESIEEASATAAQPKRDREHATVLVQNLPDNIADTRIRQYFSNCGIIKGLKVLREDTISAVIEFDDDVAAQYATSRNGQELDGSIVSVELDTGSTLYLANYSPSADEKYIRGLLEKYGEIISVRFPSLQVNKRRRFCYVQFKLPSEAAAATELDEQEIDGLPMVCKISNPAVKKQRAEQQTGTNDGRTIFIGQLNFKSTEKEIEETFSRYGKIESVRVPKKDNHIRNKGIAFITYSSLESANDALVMNGQQFGGRNIKVNLISTQTRQTSTSRTTASPAPIPLNTKSNTTNIQRPTSSEPLTDRQIFLTNIPDTVNESRLSLLASPHGTVNRVTLKTNHQGAIIEYGTAAEAGQASLHLDGHEIDPGRSIRVVTEAEMKENGREKKVDTIAGLKTQHPSAASAASANATAPTTATTTTLAPSIVRRPGQPGGRRGGRLGQKSATVFQGDQTAKDDGGTAMNRSAAGNQGGDGKKSNDDFRNLLLKK